jgi:hypothetical protein
MPAYTAEDVTRLTANVASLNQAIADGVRSVTMGGETTIYNTTQSLIAARDDQARQLAAAEATVAGTQRGKRKYLVYEGRGFC